MRSHDMIISADDGGDMPFVLPASTAEDLVLASRASAEPKLELETCRSAGRFNECVGRQNFSQPTQHINVETFHRDASRFPEASWN